MKDSIAILLKRYSEDSNDSQTAAPETNAEQVPAAEKPDEQKEGDHKALETLLAKCDGMTEITADSLKEIMAAVKADTTYFKDSKTQVAVFKQLAAAQKQLATSAPAGGQPKTDANGGTTPDPNAQKTAGETSTTSSSSAPLDKNAVARTTTGFNLLKQTFGNLNIPKEQWANYLNNYITTMM